MAEALFDQSALPIEKRTLPLRPFQRTILATSTLFNFLDIYAPSQSGKTTAVSALASVLLYEYPGVGILILSSREEQAQRIIYDIRNSFIKCHKVKELQDLDPKGGDSQSQLRIKQSQSSVIALPHSMRALTGNPARVVLLDEVARWESEDPRVIYSEAVARTGDKPGALIISISTFNGEGLTDPSHSHGYRGNFFHHHWEQSWLKRKDPNKIRASFRFTYHVSPNLLKTAPTVKAPLGPMPEELWNEHYMGIPRKVAGAPIFSGFFKPSQHIQKDNQMNINENEPLFICFDPGDVKSAAVIGQLDPTAARLSYLRAYLSEKILFQTFVDTVLLKLKRQFPGYDYLFMMDANSDQKTGETPDTFASILANKIGYDPILHRQPIEPGVEIMRSFMKRTDGFQISDHPECAILVEALESGLICAERNGVSLRKYKKDGHYDHVGDAARYPAYYLSDGLVAGSLGNEGPGYYVANSPYDQ